ncbi:MAG: hypothetical protein WAM09_02455 [Anaerolineales bacterium]
MNEYLLPRHLVNLENILRDIQDCQLSEELINPSEEMSRRRLISDLDRK